jgi:hypothetical protein
MDSERQYTAQRAELLANLVLTRRKDLDVRRLGTMDDIGLDYIVRVAHQSPDSPINPYFGVQVRGTSKELPDERAAARLANHIRKDQTAGGFLLAPLLLMLFSMEDDQGYSGWLMEPIEGEQGPSLERVQSMEMQKITTRTIDETVTKVISWFDATADVLLKHPSAK